MLISVGKGNRGFGIANVRSWEFEPSAGILRVCVGLPFAFNQHALGEIVFFDEEAIEVLDKLKAHAAAAESTLRVMEALTASAEPVTG